MTRINPANHSSIHDRQSLVPASTWSISSAPDFELKRTKEAIETYNRNRSAEGARAAIAGGCE
jgi:hypothetical protein